MSHNDLIIDTSSCTKCLIDIDETLIRDKLSRITPYIPHEFILQADQLDCCFFDSRIRALRGTIIFVDLAGFTSLVSSLAAKGPSGNEKMQRLLEDYYTELIGSIQTYGGSVYQFAGDSILAGFSIQEGESDTENASRAVSAISLFSHTLSRFQHVEILEGLYSISFTAGASFGDFTQILLGSSERWCTPVFAGRPIEEAIEAEKLAAHGQILSHDSLSRLLPLNSLRKQDSSLFSHLYASEQRSPGKGLPPLRSPITQRLYKRCSYLIKPILFERIMSGYSGFEAEHREVTCLMIRFGGIDFNSDIADAAEQLNTFFEFIQKESGRYGGILLQTDLSDKGNVFFILFGALRAQENKELLAVDLATTIVQEKFKFPFLSSLQAGVATGPAYCGDIGAPFRKDYTVVGPVINLSARLMTLSSETGIYIDAATESKTVYNFVKERIDNISVKGFAAPITAYRIINKIKRYRGRAISYKHPMIGRSEEKKKLLSDISSSIDGHGKVLAIIGEAGIGKSRLLDSLLDELKITGGEPSIGRCYPYEQTSLYYPWKELLSLFFQIFEYYEGTTKEQIAGAALLQIFGANFKERLDSLSDLLSLNHLSLQQTTGFDPLVRQDYLFSTIHTIFKRSSDRNPIILVLEDIQWIDDKSRSLLEYIAERIDSSRICLIITARSHSDIGKIQRHQNYTEMRIPQLSDDEALSFTRLKLGFDHSEESIESYILQSAGKNPFYIESFIQNLIDHGIITSQNGKTVLSKPIDTIIAPRTLTDLVLSHIDVLSLDEQIIIKSASVIGRSFVSTALKILLPDAITDTILQQSLSKIEEMDFLARVADNPPTYLFKHITVRDVLYNTLLKTTKEQLHLILALYYEHKNKSASSEQVEKLAFHFLNARDTERALHYTILAGNKARVHFANSEAVKFYTSAISLLPEKDSSSKTKTLFMLKHNLADVNRTLGNYAEAENLYRECELFYTSPVIQADIKIGLGNVYQETARPVESIRELEAALTLLSIKTPRNRFIITLKLAEEIMLRIWRDKVQISESPFRRKKAYYQKQAEILRILNKIYILNDTEKFLWASLTLYNIAKRLRSASFLSMASGDLGMALAGTGRIDAAARFFDDALRLSAQKPHPKTEAVALSRQGFNFMFTGRNQDAIRSFVKALSIFKVIGEKWEYLSSLGALGQCYFAVSDFHRAEASYKDLGDTAYEVKNPLHIGWMFTKLSFCRYLLGSLEGSIAKELIQQGIAVSRECSDRMNVYRSYGHLASIAVNENDPRAAADCAQQIWKILKGYRFRIPHVSITLMNACEAALFAAEHGSFSKAEKQLLVHIARHSFKELSFLSETFTQLKGPAMLSEARYHAYQKNSDYAELYFSAALAVLADAPDIWLAANAYRDAAMAIPHKQEEYLRTAYSLFCECKSQPDCERVSRLMKEVQRSSCVDSESSLPLRSSVEF